MLASVGAWGAEPPRAVTIDDALRLAQDKHPALRLARARTSSAEARVDVARSAWQPLVGATAQGFLATANNTTGTYVSRRGVEIPRIGGTRSVRTGTWSPDVSTFVGVGLGQEVYDFGRIGARTRAAREAVEAERAGEGVSWHRVASDVEEACFDVLSARAVLRATDDAVARARAHRDFAKAGAGSGLRPPIELTRAEAEVARVEAQRARAEGALALSQAALAGAVGVHDDAMDVVPAEEAVRPDAGEVRHPRVVASEAALRVAEANVVAVEAEGRPDLSLTATLSSRAGGAPPSGTGSLPRWGGSVPSVSNWDVGLVFSLPLWDGTQAARVAASRADVEARRAEAVFVSTDVDRAVRVARRAVTLAETALPGLERSLDAAKANQAQADARFKAGVGTSVEVADAEALRVDAEVQLALARLRVDRARRALRRAKGETP